jgi:hypothetical protein
MLAGGTGLSSSSQFGIVHGIPKTRAESPTRQPARGSAVVPKAHKRETGPLSFGFLRPLKRPGIA